MSDEFPDRGEAHAAPEDEAEATDGTVPASQDTPQGDGVELTADECIRAGMYWFGLGDLSAAEAWWDNALALEPNNPRAEECKRLLARTLAAREAGARASQTERESELLAVVARLKAETEALLPRGAARQEGAGDAGPRTTPQVAASAAASVMTAEPSLGAPPVGAVLPVVPSLTWSSRDRAGERVPSAAAVLFDTHADAGDESPFDAALELPTPSAVPVDSSFSGLTFDPSLGFEQSEGQTPFAEPGRTEEVEPPPALEAFEDTFGAEDASPLGALAPSLPGAGGAFDAQGEASPASGAEEAFTPQAEALGFEPRAHARAHAGGATLPASAAPGDEAAAGPWEEPDPFRGQVAFEDEPTRAGARPAVGSPPPPLVRGVIYAPPPGQSFADEDEEPTLSMKRPESGDLAPVPSVERVSPPIASGQAGAPGEAPRHVPVGAVGHPGGLGLSAVLEPIPIAPHGAHPVPGALPGDRTTEDGMLPSNIWDQILAENESGPIDVPPLAESGMPEPAPELRPQKIERVAPAELHRELPPMERLLSGDVPLLARGGDQGVDQRTRSQDLAPELLGHGGHVTGDLGGRGAGETQGPSPSFEPGGFEPGAFEPGGFEPGGFEPGGFEPGGFEPGGFEPGGFEPGTLEDRLPIPPPTPEDVASFFEDPSEALTPKPRSVGRYPALDERFPVQDVRAWAPPVDVDAAAWALSQAAALEPSDLESESPTELMAPRDIVSNAVSTGDVAKGGAAERYLPSPSEVLTPWDDGPSRTAVVTLGHESGHDALPEPTPLPELEREQFFGRTSGDLVTDGPRGRTSNAPRAPEIQFDEPVELPEDKPKAPAAAWPAAWPDRTPELRLREAKDRFHLHDFEGAIELLEQLKPGDPGFEEAKSLLAEARANLLRMYESKIGDFEAVPRLLISNEEVIWLNLNHRAGFILSQIDGSVTYDDIISLSGMPRLDTLKILIDLITNRVIGSE